METWRNKWVENFVEKLLGKIVLKKMGGIMGRKTAVKIC